jgi:hypothetical protein
MTEVMKLQCSGKPMCDHDGHRDQNFREEQEQAHPIENSERQIVRAPRRIIKAAKNQLNL